jgi:hypothetical protein
MCVFFTNVLLVHSKLIVWKPNYSDKNHWNKKIKRISIDMFYDTSKIWNMTLINCSLILCLWNMVNVSVQYSRWIQKINLIWNRVFMQCRLLTFTLGTVLFNFISQSCVYYFRTFMFRTQDEQATNYTTTAVSTRYD